MKVYILNIMPVSLHGQVLERMVLSLIPGKQRWDNCSGKISPTNTANWGLAMKNFNPVALLGNLASNTFHL